MKVLLIGPVPPEIGGRNKGGVAYHVWCLANALRENGVEVELLPIGRYFRGAQTSTDLRIHGWPRGFLPKVFGAYQALRVLRTLGANLTVWGVVHTLVNTVRVSAIRSKLDEFDLIHVHGCYNSILPLLKGLTSTPLAVTVHSHSALEKLSAEHSQLRYFKANLQCADGVINVSEEEAKIARRLDCASNVRRYIVHNGVATDDASDSPACRRGLVFVGQLRELKRASLVVQARRELHTPDLPLAVVGDGPQKNALVRSKKPGEPVTFYGSVHNRKARRVISASKLLVVPSTSESFGLVYVEAMLEGTAVIGFGPAIRELQHLLKMDSDERSLVVGLPAGQLTPGDLAHIIDGVLEMRDSPCGKAAMERIREKARNTFSWERVGQNLLEVYRDVIQRKIGSDVAN